MRMMPKSSYAVGLATLLALAVPVTSALAQKASITRDLTPEQTELAAISVPLSDLKVTAWVDKTDEVYKPGDVLQLFVRSNQDSYLTVIDVGTSGRPLILFPNKFQKDQRVLAHQVVQIPGPDADWRIKVSGPAGVEHIKVIVSTSPEPVINPTQLAELGPVHAFRGTAQSLTRDLNIELNERRTDSRAVFDKFVRILAETGSAVPGARPAVATNAPFPAPATAPATPSIPAATTPGTTPSLVSAADLYRLGEGSFYGDSGRSDHRQALKYFTAAAEQGHVGAMYFIGRIHETSPDVDANLPKAVEWYRKAADLGNSQAMVRLAVVAGRAASGTTDRTETLQWLKKAAGQGDGMAMLHLAKMHDDGFGVERAPKEAARYLLAALKTGAWTVIDQLAKFSEDTRKQVQVQLAAGGHYKGPTEGKVGPETRAALVEFARAGA
jgi:Domain of unknown function (DUF4384)/Sel1 repeat